ncbi:hypothetical protein BH11ACT4_BH11ACT4_13690 [soil metagenome]
MTSEPELTRRQLREQSTTRLPTSQPTTRLPAASAEPAFRHERSIRPLPVALAGVGLVLVIVLALVLVGVAGKNAPPPAAATSSAPAPAPAVVAAAPSPSPSPTPFVQAPSRPAGRNECVDSTGEGGSVDLESAALALEKGDLVARFRLTTQLPGGAASLGIFAESKDGKRSYQLAASWKDGRVDSFFVHDFQRGKDTKLDARDLEADGAQVTAAFPGSIASTLGAGWRWYAFSTADGKDVDACPGDPLSFTTMTFDPATGGD